MISNMELQYVNKYARLVPYPGDEYARNVIEKLIEAFNIYKENYIDKNYNLILSNGEEIQFSILPKNLCHILGIDYKNIVSDPMTHVREDILDFGPYDSISSLDVLNRIIDRADEVIKNDGRMGTYKLFNYYKILIRCSAFAKLSNFTSFNFGCINFDKEIYQTCTKKVFTPNSTKFLFTQSDEALIPYFMLGMVQDSMIGTYVPETLFATTDYADFFINQELVVPIQLLISDNEKLSRIVATSEEKLNVLKMYRYLIQAHHTNSIINIFNDYESVLKNDTMKR